MKLSEFQVKSARGILTLLVLLISVNVVTAQHNLAIKFDSYGWLNDDDEAARLDAFVVALQSQPDRRGYLVGYNQASILPGVFLRRLYGDQHYLTELRGVNPNRVIVIEGGYRPKYTIELWLVPQDGDPPKAEPGGSPSSAIQQRYLYDEECLGCEGAVPLYLHGFGEGLRFYAAALQENPTKQALIVVRPGLNMGKGFVLEAALRAKRRLHARYGIDATRIAMKLAPRRKDNLSTAGMWIVPRPAK